jgi:iron complex transport system substrate-binding protein
MVCALGLEPHLVGVTHECDFPASVRHLPKVTRTLIPNDATSNEIDRLVREKLRDQRALYTLNLPELQRLQPDLIVTQSLCDVCAVAENEVQTAACELPGHPRVVNLEPQNLSQVFTALRQLADAAGASHDLDRVISGLQERVKSVVDRTSALTDRPRVALLEWLDPPFSCGHWNPELVRLAGGIEGLGREGEPSRTLRWDEVIAWHPEVVLIACCGFSVERTLQDVTRLPLVPGWLDSPAVRNQQVYVTDGSQYFSRPGPRLVDSLEILAHTLHPLAVPLARGLPPSVHVIDYGHHP